MKKKTADIVKVGAELTAGAMGGPIGSAAAKIMGTVLPALAEYVGDRRERRAKEFVEHFMGSGYPQETAVPLLDAEMRQAPDATKDAVLAALRALDDTLSERATPALALLARDYLRASRPKDRFFVNTLRLLRDLEDAEYEDLRRLVLMVAAVSSDPASEPPDDLVVEQVNFPFETLLVVLPNIQLPWEPAYPSLLRTLTDAGFAQISTGMAGSLFPEGSVSGVWKIARNPWAKLATLL